MKIYKVKVNDKVYQVEIEAVEEVKGNIQTSQPKEAVTVSEGNKEILAPIAGKVIDVNVKVGDVVKKGQVVAVIEAMKLENEIQSQFEGKVAEIRVSKGASVNNKDVIIVLG